MLFCVTTRGRESTFSNPRDSAIESMASIRMLLLAFRKVKPLLGEVEPRLENNGIVDPRPASGRYRNVTGRQAADGTRGCAGSGVSADRTVSVAPTKAQLRTDVAGKLPRRRYYASLDFHFLRLAIQLRQQAIDRRNHFRNVVDDHGVGTFIRNHFTALREKLLYREHDIFGVGIAQVAGNRNFFHRQRLG